MKNKWLSENVANILDILMVTGFLFIAYKIIDNGIVLNNENREIIFYVLGALMAIVTTIYGYHRGSSQGSRNKEEMLSKKEDKKD
jgi:hypothetical protein